MKKIVAGILAAVIGVSVAASGAVKAGNRQETSAGWNNGICVNSSVCPNHHNNTGDCAGTVTCIQIPIMMVSVTIIRIKSAIMQKDTICTTRTVDAGEDETGKHVCKVNER